jgi:hypothetical protein
LRIASEEAWPVTQREKKVVLELLDGPDYQEEQAYRERLDAFYEQARR